MDDDCQRGLYKTYQVLVTLIDYKAIDIKNKSELCISFKCTLCYIQYMIFGLILNKSLN